MHKTSIIFIAATLTVLTGCSGTDTNADSTSTTIAAGDLEPADAVASADSAADATSVAFGAPADLGDGVVVTVSNPRTGGDDLGPWVEIDARVENRSGAAVDFSPTIAIVCGGSPEEGGTQIDGTFDTMAAIPAGSFREGTLHLLNPGDPRTGEPVTACGTPAVIRTHAQTFGPSSATVTTFDYALGDEFVAHLNP